MTYEQIIIFLNNSGISLEHEQCAGVREDIHGDFGKKGMFYKIHHNELKHISKKEYVIVMSKYIEKL